MDKQLEILAALREASAGEEDPQVAMARAQAVAMFYTGDISGPEVEPHA